MDECVGASKTRKPYLYAIEYDPKSLYLRSLSLRIPWDDTDYVDDSDYADDGDDTSAGSFMKAYHRTEAAATQAIGQSLPVCKDEAMVPQERHQQDTAVISVINVINRHQMPASRSSEEIQGLIPYVDNTVRAEQNDACSGYFRCSLQNQ
jgi:hypothetical protein